MSLRPLSIAWPTCALMATSPRKSPRKSSLESAGAPLVGSARIRLDTLLSLIEQLQS